MKQAFLGLGLVLGFSAAAVAGGQIHLVGSSTVYPFATIVAERFGKGGKFPTPTVESTGTGGGFKIFCGGNGSDTPDISDASRPITEAEIATCKKNGVTNVSQIPIGIDGITFSNSKTHARFSLTRRQLWLAIAKQVPAGGKLVDNPYKKWSDIDPTLPGDPILIYGRPSESGTFDAMKELIMKPSCKGVPELDAITDPASHDKACLTVREDGAWVESGDNNNVIVQKVEANPSSLGMFGYSFLAENTDRIQGSVLDGIEPTEDNIAAGKYPAARLLYIYVKLGHLGGTPGLKEFIAEFISDKATGDEGYLVDAGLIPLTADQHKKAVSGAFTPLF
ncbi:MAG TPA: substrate-binding domain-containing protein [Dongiaceae bacterium]|jgi:phosphate transport system substrate-binding protein|nr:substrate-binding domain-containing protein [Dongiaceae bacterium]